METLPGLFALSLAVSWSLVLVGFATGSLMGLQFHKPDWLGGYGSFPRRLLRLGHIACFGLPILNTLLILLFLVLRTSPFAVSIPVVLWLVGQVSMPLFCFLTAWKQPFRHGFYLPVASLIVGTLWIIALFLGMDLPRV